MADLPRDPKLNSDFCKLLEEKDEEGETMFASLISLERNSTNPAMLPSAFRVSEPVAAMVQ